MLQWWFENGLNWTLLNSGERAVTVVAIAGLLFLFVALPYLIWSGAIKNFGLRALERRFDGIRLHETAEPGDVSLSYHVYRGFLVWVVEMEYRVIAPRQDAVVLLGRLLRYNLSWGLMSRAAFFVPFLAIGNYYAQVRSIRRQMENP